MTLIDGDKIVTAQLYDDEHEEFIDKKMSIIDLVNTYTDEGVTISDVLDKMKSEIADSLEFWDYSPNNNPLARDILETVTNFWGDIKSESEDVK